MADKSLVCTDCGKEFVFTAGEQDFYAQKGFTNPPSRCPDCPRPARLSARWAVVMVVALAANGRCTRPCALSAVRKLKFPSSRAATGPCIALTASRRKSLRVAATAVVAAVAPAAAAATAVAATAVVAAVAPAAAATAVVAVAAAALAARIAIVAAGGTTGSSFLAF